MPVSIPRYVSRVPPRDTMRTAQLRRHQRAKCSADESGSRKAGTQDVDAQPCRSLPVLGGDRRAAVDLKSRRVPMGFLVEILVGLLEFAPVPFQALVEGGLFRVPPRAEYHRNSSYETVPADSCSIKNAELLIPPKKLSRSSLSFGACAFSSGSPIPISRQGASNNSVKVATMGIDPPSLWKTGRLAKACFYRFRSCDERGMVQGGDPRFAPVHTLDFHLNRRKGQSLSRSPRITVRSSCSLDPGPGASIFSP